MLNAAPPITAIAFAPDYRQVLIGSQSGIEIRSWPDLAIAGIVETELAHVHDLQFSPNGKTLLAAGGAPAEFGAVEVTSWPSKDRVGRVAVHEDLIYRVAWAPNGLQWASAAADSTCSVVDGLSGEPIARYTGHSRPVLDIKYLQDGKTLISVGIDQTIRLWDSTDGSHVRTLDNHVGTVNAISSRPPDSSEGTSVVETVATISEDCTVRFWQPTIGRLMRFSRLPSAPRSLSWSKSGDQLFVGCNDGMVRVLDFNSMAVIKTLDSDVGRLNELIIDFERNKMLVGGTQGFRRLEPIFFQ